MLKRPATKCNMVVFLVALVCLWLSLASRGAHAAYPSDHNYICSWTRGAAKGMSVVRMSTVTATANSAWKSGTLKTTFPNGSTASNPVQLIRPSTIMGGRGTSWIFRQQNPNVSCGFYSIDDGEELVWKDCSNGTTQRCAAEIRRIGQTTDPCNCGSPSLTASLEWAACIARCMAPRPGDVETEVRETCTQDLVSAILCFHNYLKIINSHPNEWGWDIIFGEGRTCQESSQCPARTWCVLGACKRQGHAVTGSPCTETSQCPSGDLCSLGVCTHERDVSQHP
jgi:hypothetical protein